MAINKYIEHTLLKQDLQKFELEKLFKEAVEYKFFGVCVNPAYVRYAKQYLKDSDVKIVTVVGFPLGANTPEVKAFEAEDAIQNGADEIDMVINVSKLKDKDYDYVLNDIRAVRAACPNNNLKVILETDLLTGEEIKKACEICVEAGANLVKTSTGFVKGGIGAKAEDVKLMSDTVKPYGLRVKASGGIRDYKKALELINAGADRLGASAGVAIAIEALEKQENEV
ncbi:MAG: deoxyribose-phosphate aldolase [Candidatus Gastranaerophilales bacterium]|nr:deoxyribose-phosphate aldolase [Candidatus Gastranaerophilales bacterium]